MHGGSTCRLPREWALYKMLLLYKARMTIPSLLLLSLYHAAITMTEHLRERTFVCYTPRHNFREVSDG